MIRDFTEARFRERNQFIADNLARNCELGLIIEDRRMLQRLADNLLTEESLVLVEIQNAQGEIVARAEKPNKGPTTLSTASVRLRKIGEMNVPLGSTPSESDTAVLGSVRLAFSLAHIQALSRDLALTFVFISLVIVVFALSCFFLFARGRFSPPFTIWRTQPETWLQEIFPSAPL